jgi:hypothetical protein
LHPKNGIDCSIRKLENVQGPRSTTAVLVPCCWSRNLVRGRVSVFLCGFCVFQQRLAKGTQCARLNGPSTIIHVPSSLSSSSLTCQAQGDWPDDLFHSFAWLLRTFLSPRSWGLFRRLEAGCFAFRLSTRSCNARVFRQTIVSNQSC